MECGKQHLGGRPGFLVFRCSGAAVVGGSEGDKQVTDKREADWLSEKKKGGGVANSREDTIFFYI